jgi:hypothetical protein
MEVSKMMLNCDTYYGVYRTRTFADIFPSYEEFIEDIQESPLYVDFDNVIDPNDPKREDLDGLLTYETLYYMLYAHYGNSHIAYSDENQFRFYLYTLIHQYGPTVAKKAYVQSKLRSLSQDELLRGGKAIYNHAFNPGTEPSTATLTELTRINDQNTSNHIKSVMEGYANLLGLLETDVLDEFIHRFRRLFIKVLAADYPLYYTTEEPLQYE